MTWRLIFTRSYKAAQGVSDVATRPRRGSISSAMATATSPLDTGQPGARAPIHAAQLDSFGKRLATATTDIVTVWDVETRTRIAVLSYHEGPVLAVTWAHSKFGACLATAGEDKNVVIWQEAEPEWFIAHKYKADAPVLAAAFSPWEYGLQLAFACAAPETSDTDGNGKVYVLAYYHGEGSHEEDEEGKEEEAAAAAAALLAAASGGGSGDEDAGEAVRAPSPRKVIGWPRVPQCSLAHKGGAFAVCWAPATAPWLSVASVASSLAPAPALPALPPGEEEAKLAAKAAGSLRVGDRQLVTGGADKLVIVWRWDRREKTWTEQWRLSSGHEDWVRDVAWRPNCGLPSNQLASCADDGSVVLWRQIGLNQAWDVQEQIALEGGASAWHLSWSATGSCLAVSTSKNEVIIIKETECGGWVIAGDATEPIADADTAVTDMP